MNETDAWNSFMMSGSVLDYLRYKSIQYAKDAEKPQEDSDEIQDKRTDNQTAEHW